MLELFAGLALVTSVAEAAPAAEVGSAQQWVQLIDQQRWDDSWTSAGTLFRSQVPKERWASTIKPVREPLGTVISRKLQGSTKTGSLPGAPDGEYQVVQFATSFANKKEAVETVVLAPEAAGWKVNGYFIR